jgi:hypothetical protein
MSDWCQAWNHFSLDWAILSSVSLRSIRPNFLQPLTSSTAHASPEACCQKLKPCTMDTLLKIQTSCSSGMAKVFFWTVLQAPLSCSCTALPLLSWLRRASTPAKQSLPDARFLLLERIDLQDAGFCEDFHSSVVCFEESSYKMCPTKNRIKRK